MTDLASYIYSTYSTIFKLSTEEILHVGFHSIDGNPIPSFDQELLINLCSEAKSLFEKEENILEIDGDVVVVGDIHGSLHDLLRILKNIEMDRFKVLFLGDYVDRGCFSLECITILFTLKILYPNKYFLLRGNHEFDSMCSQYGFRKEILTYHNPKGASKSQTMPNLETLSYDATDPNVLGNKEIIKDLLSNDSSEAYYSEHNYLHCYKYSEKLYKAFIDVFSYLPIAAILNNTSICIHGGISPSLHKISSIKTNIQRPIYDFDDNKLLCDMLWGDPSHKTTDISQLFHENPRGRGKLFTGIAISDFLKGNNLKRLIRGHECVINGIENRFNEKSITVFSASSYNKDLRNSSGILKVYKNDDVLEPVSYPPFEHLAKVDASYFKVQAYYEHSITKPIFSVSTSRTPLVNNEMMVPLSQTKSDVIFQNQNNCVYNNDRVSMNNSQVVIGCPVSSSALKLYNMPNGSRMSLNRKSKFLPKTGRMNTCFVFNTGIKQKISAGNSVGQVPIVSAYPKRHMSFQSPSGQETLIDDGNVSNISNEDQVQPSKVDSILPKLIPKEEA
ncbi:hypothetical protein M9Y10_026320 [Tritrichomonas musculus]|uniref:Serine/threonine-protein phosphatase n=1 Tax=Tritrichomonas musculus TaxID=1915356 RepID=A0ABR2H7G0_9EUKA